MTSQIVSKLRYMARQYTSGSVARGGNPGKHYLDEAADRIEELEAAQPAVEPLTDNDCTPNHLCKGRMVHLPNGEQCDRCGHE